MTGRRSHSTREAEVAIIAVSCQKYIMYDGDYGWKASTGLRFSPLDP